MKKGISLIVLIITIIIIIILSATVILVLNNNNIISMAKESNFKSDVRTMQDDLSMYISKLYNEQQTHKIDANKYTQDGASDSVYTYISSFNKKYNEKFVIIENQLVYCGDDEAEKNMVKELNVQIFELDKYAGDLSKDGKYDGTIEKPYNISCIEDLVSWSNNYSSYRTSCITLERTLDFSSKFSYNDYKTTKFGDINKDGKTDALITELTTGSGFKSITQFFGEFDGKGFEIQNIYINSTSTAGLIASSSNAKVSNLGITGNITTTSSNAGGFAGSGTGIFTNCYNKCNIKSKDYAGGIIGYPGVNCNFTINGCYNMGNIESSQYAGGIFASCHGDGCKPKIYNCFNQGNVTGLYSGGIVGKLHGLGNLINCYNAGNVSGDQPGGIISQTYSKCVIANCFNVGKISSTSENLGAAGFNFAVIFVSKYPNSLYYEECGELKFVVQSAADYKNIKGSTKEYMQSQELIDSLNQYVDNYIVQDDGIELNKWKYNPGNYPTF